VGIYSRSLHLSCTLYRSFHCASPIDFNYFSVSQHARGTSGALAICSADVINSEGEYVKIFVLFHATLCLRFSPAFLRDLGSAKSSTIFCAVEIFFISEGKSIAARRTTMVIINEKINFGE